MSNATTNEDCVATKSTSSQQTKDSVGENYYTPVLHSLVISVFLLLIVSYLKYHIDKKNTAVDYCLFFLEFPIDFGNVLISTFIAYYFLVSNVNAIFIAIFAEMFLMTICMTLRNNTISLLNEDFPSKCRISLLCFLEFGLVLIPLIALFIWI